MIRFIESFFRFFSFQIRFAWNLLWNEGENSDSAFGHFDGACRNFCFLLVNITAGHEHGQLVSNSGTCEVGFDVVVGWVNSDKVSRISSFYSEGGEKKSLKKIQWKTCKILGNIFLILTSYIFWSQIFVVSNEIIVKVLVGENWRFFLQKVKKLKISTINLLRI